MDKNVEFLMDNLTDMGIATQEECVLACNLMGWTTQTLEQVLYIRTGYRTLEQLWEGEEDEEIFQY